MLNYRTYPAILALATLVATFATSNILTSLWPHICWLPRIGGTLVGVSVIIQGYVSVNPEKFSVSWRWGLTREQAYLHFSNLSAVIGTFMWAFGDLIPKVLWVPNTACTMLR